MFRKTLGSLLMGLLIVAVVACGSAPAATSNLSATWATVNGQKITGQQVVNRLHLLEFLQPTAASQLKTHTVKVAITNELVSEMLVKAAAKQAGIVATKSSIQTTELNLTQQITQSYGTAAKTTAAMKKLGVTQAQVRAYAALSALLDAYVTKKVPAPTVTSAQALSFYNANKSQFTTPEQYDVRHILVKTKALAQEILTKLQAGASFAALAKQYSTDTVSAKNGGDLGYAPLSTYVTPFADAVAKLKVGQTSPIVHSQYGYHIIQLLGTKPPSTQPFSAVQSEITSYLQSQAQSAAIQKMLTTLQSKAKVKVTVPKNA